VTPFAVRPAVPEEAEALLALIEAHQEEGHLLPRTLGDLQLHAPRFLVFASREIAGGPTIVACGELAPLSQDVAEIRSLVVDRACRGRGFGTELVAALERRARLQGFARLCAFTHRPDHFVKLGFSMVPHAWLPEKIAADCRECPLFRRCGQHAMVRSLRSIQYAAATARRAGEEPQGSHHVPVAGAAL
jgi:amino-acid N-acetyltransferase